MQIVIATLALFSAAASGLIFAAARSDFVFRGCHDMARKDWSATVNCEDSWFAQVAFGGMCGLLMSLSAVLFYRRFVG